jgi:hypothetical protein
VNLNLVEVERAGLVWRRRKNCGCWLWEEAQLSNNTLRRFGRSFVWFVKWVLAPLILGALVIAGAVLLYRQEIDFDTFLNYFALGLLVFVVITLFYGIIAIHDIPYEIAHRRDHPHQDAIHAAGWVSLFTLHALWPFLWIWAMLYRPERGWGFKQVAEEERALSGKLDELLARVEKLEAEPQRKDGRKPRAKAEPAEMPALPVDAKPGGA